MSFLELLMLLCSLSWSPLKQLHQLLCNISKYIWGCLKLFPDRMMRSKIHVQIFWRKICSPSSNLVRLELKPEWTSEPTTKAATELKKSKNLLHNLERMKYITNMVYPSREHQLLVPAPPQQHNPKIYMHLIYQNRRTEEATVAFFFHYDPEIKDKGTCGVARFGPHI